MNKEYSQKYWQIYRGTKIVYDDFDIRPPFKVVAELSNLIPSNTVAEAFLEEYPGITFASASLVDGSIIIQDLNPTGMYDNELLNDKVRALNNFAKNTIQVVDAKKLTTDLIRKLKALNLNKPLFVFPGNGALSVKDYMENAEDKIDLSNSIFLKTERQQIKPGQFKLFIESKNIPDNLPKTIVIIDDVVASGQTTGAVAFRLNLKNYKSTIISASWIYLYGAYPENTDKTITSLALKGNYVKRPPINSLSCLANPNASYDETKKAYAQKYFEDPQEFTTAVNGILQQ